MVEQNKVERKADFKLSEILSNYYNVKYYNTEKTEDLKYNDIILVKFRIHFFWNFRYFWDF